MAALKLLRSSSFSRILLNASTKRCLSSDVHPKTERNLDSEKHEKPESSQGWLSRLLIKSVDTGHESQSSVLSHKDTVYELRFDSVKPEGMDQYLHDFGNFADNVSSNKTAGQLIGSWTVEVGDLDEAVHLWQFDGGYDHLTEHRLLLRRDKDLSSAVERQKRLLRSTRNQILLAFSFWPEVKPRDGRSIYELRSYVLKPGTMIEWGNSWSRGIKFRTEQNEAVAGFFSQIGDQNNVHHFWAYKDLQTRKEIRDLAWSRPGWDSCVADTVLLIRHMTSRILIPTRFSPLQ